MIVWRFFKKYLCSPPVSFFLWLIVEVGRVFRLFHWVSEALSCPNHIRASSSWPFNYCSMCQKCTKLSLRFSFRASIPSKRSLLRLHGIFPPRRRCKLFQFLSPLLRECNKKGFRCPSFRRFLGFRSHIPWFLGQFCCDWSIEKKMRVPKSRVVIFKGFIAWLQKSIVHNISLTLLIR